MNATAKALGALDTRAATPSGLDGPGQSTSAYDLALFAKADMAMGPFPEMIARTDIKVPAADGEGYIAANDNQLLARYPGALGGKTGFTDDAGNTFVGMAAKDGPRLVVTMMNGTQQPRRQWMQAASLLDWGFALPAGTAPVGELVNSLAEATGAPSPTPSLTPTASPSASTGPAASTSLSEGGSSPAAGESSSGIPVAWILAAIGLLVVGVGVVLLVRRRQLNKRATFAGDAKPMPEPNAAGAATPPGPDSPDPDPDPDPAEAAGAAEPVPADETTDPAEPAPVTEPAEPAQAIGATDTEPANDRSADSTGPAEPPGNTPEAERADPDAPAQDKPIKE
jgi:D-alanyl-D-alanine carboxypeptidase (penicillin-binding protein 5/6)